MGTPVVDFALHSYVLTQIFVKVIFSQPTILVGLGNWKFHCHLSQLALITSFPDIFGMRAV